MDLEFNIFQTKLWNQFFFFISVESLTLIKLDRLIITQRKKIIKTYYKNGDSAIETYWRNCEEILRDWSDYKYWKACALSFRSFRWKYRYCMWKCCRRHECLDCSSSSGIMTLLRHNVWRIFYLNLHPFLLIISYNFNLN